MRNKALGDPRKRIQALKNQAQNGSVEEAVASFRNQLAICGETFDSLGIDEDEVGAILKTGYESEARVLSQRAIHYANFRDVTPELNAYNVAAAKAGFFPSPKLAAALARAPSQSQQSVARVRNSCKPERNFAAKLGPVRDQGTMGWCYAFVAADLVSARTGKRISALGSAIAYNEENPTYRRLEGEPPSQIQIPGKKSPVPILSSKGGFVEEIPHYQTHGGNTLKCLEAMKKRGACLEEDLNSEDNGITWLNQNLKRLDEVQRSRVEETCRNGYEAAQNLFPEIAGKTFSKILGHITDEQLVTELARVQCKPRIDVNLEFAEVKASDAGLLPMIEALDAQITAENPVGIAYNPDFLKDRESFSEEANHASTIVGRRYNEVSGECEYLLRNSWGRGCGQYVYECEPGQEGNVWIPQGALARSLRDIQYIK